MRRLVLLRTVPTVAKEASLKMKKRYKEGKEQEEIMRRELIDTGFKLIHFESSLTWDEYKEKGKPDDLIHIPGNDKRPHVLEYKSCSPQMFREIRRFEGWGDFLKSKFPWVRHMPTQVMNYVPILKANDYDINDEAIFMYFKDRDSGNKHQVIIYYDDEFMQMILKGLKKVNEYVANGTNEEPEYKDSCRWCDYHGFCFDVNETRRNGDIKIINDADAEADLIRYHEIKPIAKECDEIYGRLKESYKGLDEPVVIGDYRLSTTKYPATIYDVPEEIRVQYKGTAMRERFNIKPRVKAL